jgi:metal-dependent amidase/aminoacylase/carboxypeptidase family protein
MYDDALIELRRDIHRWPEPAGAEERTAALVADRLQAAGLEVTAGVGGHGIVAVLHGDEPGPAVAYRADLDAVPDTETFDSDFRSRVRPTCAGTTSTPRSRSAPPRSSAAVDPRAVAWYSSSNRLKRT